MNSTDGRLDPRSQMTAGLGPGNEELSRDGRGKGKKWDIAYESC